MGLINFRLDENGNLIKIIFSFERSIDNLFVGFVFKLEVKLLKIVLFIDLLKYVGIYLML